MNKSQPTPSTPPSTTLSTPSTLPNENVDECVVDSKLLKKYKVDANDYKKLSLRDQIFLIPDTYLGSDEQVERPAELLDLETIKLKEAEIKLPVAIERIFIEVLSNAGDNVERSSSVGINPGDIVIKVDKEWVSIKNGGLPIPVQINKEEKVYAAEMILGNLLTSSNYNIEKTRTGCGRNGYGAKLVNIFADEFIVEIGDPENGLYYIQTWKDGMQIRGEPLIKPYTGKPFVHIKYKLNFKRFGYTEYPEEAIQLFARHAAEESYTVKVPVKFNGIKLYLQKAENYKKIFSFAEESPKYIVYNEWDPAIETVTKRGVSYAVNPYAIPKLELCIVDTPDEGRAVSFANGMMTKDGGVHLDAAYLAIAKPILDLVNGTKKKNKEKNKIKLTVADIRRHISVFISCRVPNPKYSNQSKTSLTTPKINIKIPDTIIKSVYSWELITRLHNDLEAKMFKLKQKTDGGKKRHVNIPNTCDANKAGTGESTKCTVYITEGLSASTFAGVMIAAHGKDGNDYEGRFPLKGKPLNVRNAHDLKIFENTEFQALKKFLGLREGVDYSLDENFNTLRYGKVVILADSDVDGKHIVGLVINMFEHFYPSLLGRGYMSFMRTPIMRAYKGKKHVDFFTQNQYDEWNEKTGDKTWKIKYFKGLGSSNDEEIERDAKNNKNQTVKCLFDENASSSLNLAFHSSLADKRKEWLTTFDAAEARKAEDMTEQPISMFINHELIQFSLCDIRRSIPGFMDGLKESQRKIIWGSMLKWGADVGKANADQYKTERLAAFIAENTNYHHAGTCIGSTITAMAQDFVGTNNLPYFVRGGQFGSREYGIKGAANARYTSVCPEWWWPLVFRKEDHPLYKLIPEEGKEWEPESLYPIIPLLLVNGSIGIGTGHSTWIPSFNPLDIANWYISKLSGEATPPLIPWFRGFTGETKLVAKKAKPIEKEEDDDDKGKEEKEEQEDGFGEDDVNANSRISLQTIGKFEITGNVRKTIRITELPIGRLIDPYKQWLDKMIKDKVITNYTTYCTPNTVDFYVNGMKNPSIKNLRLQRSFGLSNMVALDSQGKPIKFNTFTDMLETFYQQRLGLYTVRKEHMLKQIRQEIDTIKVKLAYIEARNTNKITCDKNTTKDQLYAQMDKHKFPRELAKTVTDLMKTDTAVKKLETIVKTKEIDYKQIEKTTTAVMWMNDINEFIKGYCKNYKCKNNKA